MSKKRWEQIGASSGIIFLVVQFLAQGLIQVGGSEPSFNASAEEILDFFLIRDRLLLISAASSRFFPSSSFFGFWVCSGHGYSILKKSQPGYP
jgi:hypothetical protein